MNKVYRQHRKKTAGFTLVEIMVVIVIIGILAGIVGVNVISYLSKAKVNAAKTQIASLHNAVNMYKIDTGEYPDNATGLSALVVQPPGVTNWNSDGYLDGKNEIPLDPWNNEYEYLYPGSFSKFDILTLGADGVDGGENENADIYNSDVVNKTQSSLGG